MPLSEQIIVELAEGEKPYKRFDAHGLYLLVNPNGSKYWRLKFRIAGKEKGMGFGAYPAVSLDVARACAVEARQLVRQGIDPCLARKIERARARRELKAADMLRALRVASLPDGTFELWKGRSVLRLNVDEARHIVRLFSDILS